MVGLVSIKPATIDPALGVFEVENTGALLTKTRNGRVSAARALVAPAIERSAWRRGSETPEIP
jgi:hypothetical protein